MDTKQIRVTRLKQWFANRSIPEREKSYLSQLMSGKSSFGERAARRLEETYGMGNGFLDQALNELSPQNAEELISSCTITQYKAGGSMGYGLVLPDQPGVIQNWSVSPEWINKNVRNITSISNLCIVTGFGPSMQPMFNPGDPLLVDTGIKSVIADGIYFFRVGTEGFIKQLQKIPTPTGIKYIAKSKNLDYEKFEITPDMDFEVLGRVVRVWCGTDF